MTPLGPENRVSKRYTNTAAVRHCPARYIILEPRSVRPMTIACRDDEVRRAINSRRYQQNTQKSAPLHYYYYCGRDHYFGETETRGREQCDDEGDTRKSRRFPGLLLNPSGVNGGARAFLCGERR